MPISAPGDLPDPGINASLRHRQAGSLPLSHLGSPCQVWLVSMECAVENRLSLKSTPGTAMCDSCQLGDGWVLTGPARLCCLRLQIIVLGQHLCTLPPGRHVESQCWAQHLSIRPLAAILNHSAGRRDSAHGPQSGGVSAAFSHQRVSSEGPGVRRLHEVPCEQVKQDSAHREKKR